MSAKTNKPSSKLWIGTIVALLVAVVLAMVLLPTETSIGGEKWGWVAGTFWYWGSFGFLYADAGLASLLGQIFFYLGVLLCLTAVVLAIRKNKRILINACLALVLGFLLSYNVLVAVLGVHFGVLTGKVGVGAAIAVAFLLGAFLTNILEMKRLCAAPVVEAAPEKKEEKEGLSEQDVRRIVREELKQNEKKEEPKQEGLTKEDVEKTVDEKTLKEERVREIVREELEGKEVVAKEEEPEPEPEPEPKEEPEEEPEEPEEEEAEEEEGEEEAPEQGQADVAAIPGADGKYPSSRRRTASFETKLKGSDYDLRHKYYDLRDYIKSYGINNRISRPGDTFSLHREKLVFIAISGKHLKVCYALNPEDYAGSTIPVDRNTAKKFEDLPLAFKVKSDLSFRRAKKLVDDLMAAKGYTKEEK